MQPGDAMMRAAILASIAAYTAAEYLWFKKRRSAFGLRAVLWTLAAALCVAHSALAFAVHHHWSHAAAVRQTATQTAAVTGLEWGGGVYVNYAFLLIWTADVAWLWIAPAAYLRRSSLLNTALSAFFLFIFVNGAVIFARGPARIVGTAATIVVVWAWATRTTRAIV